MTNETNLVVCPFCGGVGECACPLLTVRGAHCGACGWTALGWTWLDGETTVHTPFPLRAPAVAVTQDSDEAGCIECGGVMLIDFDPDDGVTPVIEYAR